MHTAEAATQAFSPGCRSSGLQDSPTTCQPEAHTGNRFTQPIYTAAVQQQARPCARTRLQPYPYKHLGEIPSLTSQHWKKSTPDAPAPPRPVLRSGAEGRAAGSRGGARHAAPAACAAATGSRRTSKAVRPAGITAAGTLAGARPRYTLTHISNFRSARACSYPLDNHKIRTYNLHGRQTASRVIIGVPQGTGAGQGSRR